MLLNFYAPISIVFFVVLSWNKKCLWIQIGVLIEDREFVDSWMGGKPWKAGKFASSLRLALWSEHLGLSAGEVCTSINSLILALVQIVKELPLDFLAA